MQCGSIYCMITLNLPPASTLLLTTWDHITHTGSNMHTAWDHTTHTLASTLLEVITNCTCLHPLSSHTTHCTHDPTPSTPSREILENWSKKASQAQTSDHIAPFQSFYGRPVAMYPSDKRHDQVIRPFLWNAQKRPNSYIFVKRDICQVGKGGTVAGTRFLGFHLGVKECFPGRCAMIAPDIIKHMNTTISKGCIIFKLPQVIQHYF